MSTIIVICSIVTLCVSYAILRSLTDTSRLSVPLSITLIVSLFLPLSVTFLIPIDINHSIPILWRANYWTTFMLTWFILPFWQYYLTSGEFNTVLRVKSSLLQLCKFLGLLIILSIVGLFWLIIRGMFQLSYISATIVTASHCYSLLMVVWLMMHGLIHIPKRFFTWSYPGKLELLYRKVNTLETERNDALFEYKEICGYINGLEVGNDVERRDAVLKLKSKVPPEFEHIRDVTFHEELTLVKAHELIKKAEWNYLHNDTVFRDTLADIQYYEKAVMDEGIFYKYIMPSFNSILFVLFTVIAFIVLESEIMHGTRFSILGWIIYGQYTAIIMSFVLVLMMICSLKTLSLIKLFDIYRVEFNGKSDPVSTIFFISYACRLTIPLGYNFMIMLNEKVVGDSSFLAFVNGNLKLIPIGVILNDIIPRLSIVPVLLSIFGIWGKLKRWMDGWIDIDLDIGNDDGIGGVQSGKVIAHRYINDGFLNDENTKLSIWRQITFTLQNGVYRLRNMLVRNRDTQLELDLDYDDYDLDNRIV
ncbi:hypothetical protein JL09_g2543 [Pichia kudriavzevii]|uniref:LMBR1 domain-containing protein 2 n=1 Tax=Pichia kudriavzevii TaxID=4909 RepID=A0A099P2U4_PICKU|nr:hypothetical protein JL09_g2543 [Pichia kudriavzevii]